MMSNRIETRIHEIVMAVWEQGYRVTEIYLHPLTSNELSREIFSLTPEGLRPTVFPSIEKLTTEYGTITILQSDSILPGVIHVNNTTQDAYCRRN